MLIRWEYKLYCLLAWVLLLAAPSGQAASISRAVATGAQRQAVLEDILAGPDTQAHITKALQADKVHSRGEAPNSLRISLVNLGLPVPPEIRDLAAAAEGGKQVTPAEADHATQVLNKMLEEQHLLLDHKVIDCREKRSREGEAIQYVSGEVRNLASETSSARSIIVEATSRIPQDRRSFEEFKAEAQISRSRCQGAGLADQVKARSLERDAFVTGAIRGALVQQCKGVAASLVQEHGNQADSVFADAKPSEDVDALIADAESTLHDKSDPVVAAVVQATRQTSLKVAGCPAVAAALGVVARKRGGRLSAAFLQQAGPGDACKLNRHSCSAMLDVAAEISGEIEDSQARLRGSSARNREACKDEELFMKNQLSMEASQASDRTRELDEATWKAGEVGDLANKKDSKRQKLQAELKAITAKCTADISGILYGKMCALQKVRDNLQILAGRTELPEDCQVTDWDEGVCSSTCGGGTKTLKRKVLLSPKGGAACPPLSLALPCGETACPKDCQIASWGGWSACSARCDGGVQERNRVITAKPVGNGVACPQLVDMRLCNSEACSAECKLLPWTPWTPCSKACDAGTQKRSRGVQDAGKASCPTVDSKDRLDHRECNAEKCGNRNAVTCAGAPMDVVLLLDASGSMTKEGFDIIKDLSLELVHDYSLSKDGTKVSVATFANTATAISSLSDDANELSSRLSQNLHWLQGPSKAGAGLSRAANLLTAGGRKSATSLVLMITDGRLVDPYLARQAATRLKERGVRLAFALVGTDYKNSDLLENMASVPEKDNIIQLPGMKELPAYLKYASKRIITSTCSEVV